mgnify:CR=1 FL=1
MNGTVYINTALNLLIPVIYIVGIVLKKSKIKNKYIPMTLGVFSISMCLIWYLSVSECRAFSDFMSIMFNSISQGVLIAGASVYANQLYIQGKKDE